MRLAGKEIAMVYENMIGLIGKTPLMKLPDMGQGSDTQILVKLEKQNPTGSAKDRAALYMIMDAEEKGILKEGGTIIEPTSGNTGIGLAAIAAVRGYRCIIVMPDTMSVERQSLIKAFGAEIVLTDGAGGMAASIKEAEKIAEKTKGSWIAGQFENDANSKAHYMTTGPEIWEDTDGNVDIFIATVGTGGTLTGTGRYLKEKNSDIKVVAVEPAASPLLSGGKAGEHGIQGIGANFIPDVLDRNVYDEVSEITDEEAFEMTDMLAKKAGILCGISSGAAVAAALKEAAKKENKGKRIVVILTDTGERYLSTGVFK